MTAYIHAYQLIDAATPEQRTRLLHRLAVSNPEACRYITAMLDDAQADEQDGTRCTECGSVEPCACFDGEDW
jgi:hypothetical protein